ncbi:hypothetical protein KHP62_00395 [Rhodobacteraceae bacterium NNCM2]|nr:hypothetical protein [Coraliihabitans acroporae]
MPDNKKDADKDIISSAPDEPTEIHDDDLLGVDGGGLSRFNQVSVTGDVIYGGSDLIGGLNADTIYGGTSSKTILNTVTGVGNFDKLGIKRK